MARLHGRASNPGGAERARRAMCAAALGMAQWVVLPPVSHADDAALLRRIEEQDRTIADQDARIEELERTLRQVLDRLDDDGAAVAPVAAPTQQPSQPAPEVARPAEPTPSQGPQGTPAPTAVDAEATANKDDEFDPFAQPTAARAYDPERGFFGPLPRLKTDDGRYSIGLFGLLETDVALYDQDAQGDNETTQSLAADLSSGSGLRRATLGVSGLIDRDWIYAFSYDFADRGETPADGIRAGLVIYRGFDPIWLVAGQQGNSVGMDASTRSPGRLFMEAASPANLAFAAGTPTLGLSGVLRTKNYFGRVGVFGEPLDKTSDSDEGWGIHGRGVWIPIADRNRTLALGGSAFWREPNTERGVGNVGNVSGFQIRSRPSFTIDDTRLVDTGIIPRIDDYYYLGAEAAAVYGPFSLQGEYAHVGLNRKNGPNEVAFQDLAFDGYYVQGSYFLTGESRNFYPRFGTFWRVQPASDFSLSSGNWGAWEVALRYSSLDLDDGVANLAGGGIRGGVLENYSVGLNWYLNAFVRVMMNYVHSDADNLSDTGLSEGDVVDSFGVRLQIEW